MLKSSITHILPCLNRLFNSILSSGHYPAEWKLGYITPIYKSGKPDDPSNYRGISIIPCVAKLFNYILNTRLQSYLDTNDIINSSQIGFQPKSRTSDHMFVLRTIIEKFKADRSKLFVCFVDFSKAFDTVLHPAMLVKLNKIGISGNFFAIIQDLYKNTSFCIKTKNNLSDSVQLNVGVKQGDNLSPNLFKIYINDLPLIFNQSDDPISLGSTQISCLLYADDLILMSSTKAGLQSCIDKLSDYCTMNCLTVNLKKTQTMVFGRGKPPKLDIYFRNHLIEQVDKYKYLGLIFSANGDFNISQEDLSKGALRAYFKLPKCCDSHSIRPKSFLHLFDHTIKPILLYACEIWGTINTLSKTIKQPNYSLEMSFSTITAEKVHLKALKFMLGVNKKATNDAIYGETGRLPLFISIISQTVKYYQRLINIKNDNSLLSLALEESTLLYQRGKPSWVTSTHFLLQHCNVQPDNVTLSTVKRTKSQAILNFRSNWRNRMHICNTENKGKLRTYSKFKNNIEFEKYLDVIPDGKLRSCYTKFRISAHKLEIEYGRYNKTPLEKRVCRACNSGDIEDEMHLLLKCTKYERDRTTFLLAISSLCKNFASLADKDKFIFLLSNEDNNVIKLTAEFISNCFLTRFMVCVP